MFPISGEQQGKKSTEFIDATKHSEQPNCKFETLNTQHACRYSEEGVAKNGKPTKEPMSERANEHHAVRLKLNELFLLRNSV